MSHHSIKELATQFGTTERTIYNYLEKYPSKIRIRKEDGNQMINFNDIFKVVSKRLQNFYSASQGKQENALNSGFGNLKQTNEEVQKDHNNPSNPVQNFNQSSKLPPENQYIAGFEAIEKKYEKFQKQLESLSSKNAELEKAKTTFEEKSQKYALRYKDEQSERKERQNKYTTLQDQHTQKIEDFGTVRIKLERRFYLLLGMAIFLALILVGIMLLYSSNRNLG